jgi:hypothetical protein
MSVVHNRVAKELEGFSEAFKVRDKIKAKKKAAKKKAAPGKFYMCGDISHYGNDRDGVIAALPVQLLTDYCKAAIFQSNHGSDHDAYEAADKEMEAIKEVIAKKTSNLVAEIVGWTASLDTDAKKILNAIRRGKGTGTGETESVAGWGPTRKIARAEYDALQGDDFEEYDW